MDVPHCNLLYDSTTPINFRKRRVQGCELGNGNNLMSHEIQYALCGRYTCELRYAQSHTDRLHFTAFRFFFFTRLFFQLGQEQEIREIDVKKLHRLPPTASLMGDGEEE